MEISFKDLKIGNNKISFSIKEKEMNGIITDNIELIRKIFSFDPKVIQNSKINKKTLNINDILTMKKKISIIKNRIEQKDYYLTVYDILLKTSKRKKLEFKNPDKKILDSLKVVGLPITLLDRRIYSLSSSEKKLLLLAIGLLSNPEYIIIEDPFEELDRKNEKKMILLFQKIKEQYNKTIVMVSNRSEKNYQYSTNLVIINHNKVLLEGKTEEVFKKIDFLKENKIEIPEIAEITYLAMKKKKVKIDYHKDVRDIIKDIYKHV